MLSDLKYALRLMGKSPGFSSAVVLILALGIGTAAAIFSVVDAVLLKPLAYDQPAQLFQAYEVSRPGNQNNVSPAVFYDWREQGTLFEGFAAYSGYPMNLTGAGEAARISGLMISANGFQLLRARPILGRTFAPDEDAPGKDRVVVLATSLWQSRFGGTADIIGRPIVLNNEAYTVIGVLPAELMPVEHAQFAVPYAIPPQRRQVRDEHSLNVLGRLKPGVTLEQGRAELAAIAVRQKPLYPNWKKNWTSSISPLDEYITREARPSLLILVVAVGLLFVIACVNVANLLIARAAGREREMAVRAALGAPRHRIIRQLLIESVLLAVLGALFGSAAAFAGLGGIRHLAGAMAFPRVDAIALNPLVLGVTLLAALLTGIAFGLMPALQASRPELTRALKEGGRGSEARSGGLRSGLIVAEVGLSLVLLVGAGLLLRSFLGLTKIPPGFNPEHALTLVLSLSDTRYPTDDARLAFYQRLAERVEALPGIEAAGFSDRAPLEKNRSDRFFRVPGWSGDHDPGFDADNDNCTPDYFRAAGIPLRLGRFFEPADIAQHRRVAIINEAMARACFSGENPVGRKLSTRGLDQDWIIVGVVADVRSRDLALPAKPTVFLSAAYANERLVVRTAGDPLAQAEPIRKAILGLDADLPVAGVRTLAAAVDQTLALRQLMLWLFSFFALSALLLAGVGLYGVIAYAVSQRTREFGIRAALGASPGNLIGLVLRRGLLLAVGGLAIGGFAALSLTRLLGQLLYGISPDDPLTFAAVALLLLAVAIVASWLPAHRAAQVDPLVALRAE